MTYQKTWFSYVLWAAYAGICVMLLAFMGFYLCRWYGPAGVLADMGAFLVFPATIIVYRLVRILSRLIRQRYTMHPHTASMIEAFVVAFSVVFGILYRFSAMLRLNILSEQPLSASAFSLSIQDIISVPYASYYDMAVVRAGQQVTPLTHGAGYLYVLLVSTVCSFLGNKLISAMLLQVVIELVSIIIAYVAVRKAAGRLPACVVILYLSFSNAYVSGIGTISPDNFVFLLYLVGLCVILHYIKGYCDNRFARGQMICGALLVGVAVGILVYLDMKMVILLLYLAALFTGKKKSEEGQPDHHTIADQVIAFVVTLVSCCGALCAAFGIAAVNRQSTFGQVASNWLSLYINKSNVNVYHNMTQLQNDFPAVVLIVIAASFLIFEIFRKEKEQNYMLWLLVCLVIAPTPMTEIGILPYEMISIFQWCVLAGLGIQNCVFGGKAEVVQAKIEAINATAEPIAFLANPLPLPKKHVKKEMDYEYPVEEKDMKYDVEVDDSDDYDIP